MQFEVRDIHKSFGAKHVLKATRYIRYVDDFLFLHESTDYLKTSGKWFGFMAERASPPSPGTQNRVAQSPRPLSLLVSWSESHA